MLDIACKSLMLSSALCCASIAQAEGTDSSPGENHIAVGAGALLQKAPFNKSKTEAFPLPLISIKQGAYYFEAAETGFHLEKDFESVRPSVDVLYCCPRHQRTGSREGYCRCGCPHFTGDRFRDVKRRNSS